MAIPPHSHKFASAPYTQDKFGGGLFELYPLNCSGQYGYKMNGRIPNFNSVLTAAKLSLFTYHRKANGSHLYIHGEIKEKTFDEYFNMQRYYIGWSDPLYIHITTIGGYKHVALWFTNLIKNGYDFDTYLIYDKYCHSAGTIMNDSFKKVYIKPNTKVLLHNPRVAITYDDNGIIDFNDNFVFFSKIKNEHFYIEIGYDYSRENYEEKPIYRMVSSFKKQKKEEIINSMKNSKYYYVEKFNVLSFGKVFIPTNDETNNIYVVHPDVIERVSHTIDNDELEFFQYYMKRLNINSEELEKILDEGDKGKELTAQECIDIGIVDEMWTSEFF